MTRMVVAPPTALFSMCDGRCGGGGNGEGEEGGGGGGGAMSVTVGGVTTSSTAIETPVTFTNIADALLGLLVALDITDCTEVAVAVGVSMLTSAI